jgi:hypothetical protein
MLMIDCVYYVFTLYVITNLLVMFVDLISLLYEQETYDVYALILITMVHILSVKDY